MADPVSPLVTAILTRWTSLQATTLAGLSGPYFGEVPTSKQSTYPRCVFTVRSRLESETSASQVWLHTVTFAIYAETPELAAAESAKVAAAFDPDAIVTGAAMSLSQGAVNSIRAKSVDYTQMDKTVWRVSLPYEFRTTRPRT